MRLALDRMVPWGLYGASDGWEPGQGRKRCRSSLVASGRVDMNEQDHWLLVLLPQGQDKGEIAGSIGPGDPFGER